MSLTPESDSDVVRSETKGSFSYKSFVDHGKDIFVRWPSLLLTTFVVFGAIWTVVESISYFFNISLDGWPSFVLALILAIVAAISHSIYASLRNYPEGLENESPVARSIAQIQRPKWEYRLARQILADKLFVLDRELTDILNGRSYIAVQTQMSLAAYVEWARLRPTNVLKMLEVAKKLLVFDFPATLLSQQDSTTKPAEIVASVERIRCLYSDTVAFERASHSVAPPEALENVHALQSGWTEPIRSGVQQMINFLDLVIDLNEKSDHTLESTITFDAPPNVEEFCKELTKVEVASLE